MTGEIRLFWHVEQNPYFFHVWGVPSPWCAGAPGRAAWAAARSRGCPQPCASYPSTLWLIYGTISQHWEQQQSIFFLPYLLLLHLLGKFWKKLLSKLSNNIVDVVFTYSRGFSHQMWVVDKAFRAVFLSLWVKRHTNTAL